MELRQYWVVVRRWWWLPVVAVLLTAALALVMDRPWQTRAPVYTLPLSFSIGMQPQGLQTGEENYYTAVASEYLIDDMAAVVRGSEFAAAVSQRLAARGIAVPPGALQGSTQSGKVHRILDITVTWNNPDDLAAIGDAIAATLEQDAGQFMPRLFAQNGAAYLVNRGGIGASQPGLRDKLELPLRLLLALAAGVALAFLAEYLDDRIRGRADVERLGLDVLAEIPRQK